MAPDSPADRAAWDAYERWCAAEQVDSDRRSGRRTAGGTTGSATTIPADTVLAAREVLCGRAPDRAPLRRSARHGASPAATLAAVEGGLPLWPVLADCRLAVPVDWGAYTGWLRQQIHHLWEGRLRDVERVTVFGVRSGGSYLAPLVCAVLVEAGIDADLRTVRPLRSTWAGLSRVTDPADYPDDEIGPLDGVDAYFVVDDLLGGGGTVAALRTRLQTAGPPRPAVLICLCEQGPPEVRRIAASAGFDDAVIAEPGTVSRTDHWHEANLRSLASDASVVRLPVSRAPVGDRRARFPMLLDGVHGRAVVRFAGSGPLARQQLIADQAASTTGLHAAGQYSVEPWRAGRRMRWGATAGGHDLGPLVAQAAVARSRAAPVVAEPAPLAGLRATLIGVLAAYGPVNLPEPESAWWGTGTTRFHVAPLPANGNHRHLVAEADGRIRRTSASRLHGERVGDAQEELAAILCELDLPPAALARLFEEYRRRTGEPVERARLLYGMLRHTVREVNEVEYLSLVVRETPGQDPARAQVLAAAARRRVAALRPSAERVAAVLAGTVR